MKKTSCNFRTHTHTHTVCDKDRESEREREGNNGQCEVWQRCTRLPCCQFSLNTRVFPSCCTETKQKKHTEKKCILKLDNKKKKTSLLETIYIFSFYLFYASEKNTRTKHLRKLFSFFFFLLFIYAIFCCFFLAKKKTGDTYMVGVVGVVSQCFGQLNAYIGIYTMYLCVCMCVCWLINKLVSFHFICQFFSSSISSVKLRKYSIN